MLAGCPMFDSDRLMVWSAAIYCTLVMPNTFVVPLRKTLVYKPRQAGCSTSGAILQPHSIGAREPPLGCCSSSLALMTQEFPIGAQDAQFAEPIHVVLGRKMVEPQVLNLPPEA
jgi:hypothetical protein